MEINPFAAVTKLYPQSARTQWASSIGSERSGKKRARVMKLWENFCGSRPWRMSSSAPLWASGAGGSRVLVSTGEPASPLKKVVQDLLGSRARTSAHRPRAGQSEIVQVSIGSGGGKCCAGSPTRLSHARAERPKSWLGRLFSACGLGELFSKSREALSRHLRRWRPSSPAHMKLCFTIDRSKAS